ncbi:PAS domain-containing sensor histidine kinase [Desertivirga xinjiangensis]|uniref:PAS domain-containing sensor histidine kinase n=1 Tax=Desertivirga xinjiangensis TaxID=539206 RepID=UPI002109BCE0|nr:PAS domain-containing protein [Pedobacter xinjiangensis]
MSDPSSIELSVGIKQLFSQAPVAIGLLAGSDMIIQNANEWMLELWGKDSSVIGLPVIEALPEIEGQPFPDILKNVYETGVEHRGYETLAKLIRNGVLETCYFNYVYSPIRNSIGEINGISVIANEVTEQVKAKKELEASENRFKGLVLNADVATGVYTGREMKIEIANDAMIKVWGKDVSVIGKTLHEALPELEGQPFHDLLQEVYTTGVSYRATEDRVNLVVDGQLQTFYFNFSYKALRNTEGEVYAILNMAVDVTEQVLARQAVENSFGQQQELNEELAATNEELAAASEEIAATNDELLEVQEYLNKTVSDLEYSESRLKYIMQEAPVAIAVMHGRELLIDSANKNILQIWGKTPAVIGKTIPEALPEIEGQPFLELLDNVFTSGNAYAASEAKVMLEHQGELKEIFCNFVYQPIKNGAGETTDIIAVAVDVTEQVRSRQIAEASEAKFRNLVKQAPVATALFKGENMVLELVNDAMLHIWGRDRSILNRELLDFMPELKGQEYPELLAEVYHTGVEYKNNESRAEIMVNGELKTYYFNFTYKPISDGNTNIGILVMCIDVTEQVISRRRIEQNELALRLSQNRLKELADSMPQMVWTATPDGYLDYYNKQWYDYTGFDENTFGDQSWEPVLHPDDLLRVKEIWYDCVKSGKIYQIEYRFKDFKKPGEYRWFLGRAVPIRDEQGNIVRWIGTNTDIHESKVLEKQKDNFLGIASHELKTPVTSIKAYTQVLEAMLRKEGDDRKAGLVYKMDVQLNKLTSLIGDLLDVTKIQTGRMQFNDDYFEFNNLVEEIIEELQRTTAKHIIVPNLEPTGNVFADKDRVGQVITNLITNAIKYSPDADKIVVYTRLENENVKLCVQDFGIGIPNDRKDKVFEQFYRVSGTKEHTFPGLGLGLYISSEIIKREGGEIWVNSAVGKGSTFCFSLPQKNAS